MIYVKFKLLFLLVISRISHNPTRNFRMKLRLQTVLPLVAAFLACTSIGTSAVFAQAPDAAAIARLKSDVAALTRFPSRVPGTPGNLAAGKFVESRFKKIGLQQVQAEEYEVTVPVTKFATLQVGGKTLKVLPMYPNHVATSTTPLAGISGKLVYAGAGTPREYNGQEIKGTIVVLDFNSGQNWIIAADLGAKAVIFLEPQTTLRGEAERKFANLPIEVPRYYAPRATASALMPVKLEQRRAERLTGAQILGDGVLKSQVIWERVKTSNIVGWVKGTDSNLASEAKNDVIVINAYYDSMSITPDLAPGAEAAANCAALLELASKFVQNKPKYSVMFVANGAHHVALAGARNFAARHFLDNGDKGRAAEVARYRAFIGLDLTSRTGTVGVFAKSWFYNQMNTSENILINQFFNFTNKVSARADGLAKRSNTIVDALYVDGITGRNGRSWRSYLPALVALDSEVATMAQKPGVSFATANDARVLQDTPFDTADKLNLNNIARQIATVSTLLGDLSDVNAMPQSSTLSQNFGYVAARAISRGEDVSFIPDTPIADDKMPQQQFATKERRAVLKGSSAIAYVHERGISSKSYAGVRGAFVERATFSKGSTKVSVAESSAGKTIPDHKPVAQFVFIGPRVGDSKGGGEVISEVQAYSLNASGRIIYAPDMGAERDRFTPVFKTANPKVNLKNAQTGEFESNASVMCFEARAVPLYDTLDQRYFSVLREMSVLDAQTDAAPVEFGFLAPLAPAAETAEIEPVGIVFGRHDSRFKLIMAQGLLGKRLVVLNTSPDKDPKTNKPTEELFYAGSGVRVPGADEDENPVIHVAYQTALDLWTLNQQRIRLLKKFGINNQRVDELHGKVGCNKTGDEKNPYDCPVESEARPNGGAIVAAQTALASFEYDKFYLESRRAFGMESRAYPDVEATSQDVLKGLLFYLALLLPFSFFVERLILGAHDIRKQIVGICVAFMVIFTGLRFVHPAFELALTPFIILLAFIILALTVVVTIFLSSKFEQEIKRLKQSVHFEDVSRLSTISAALGLGIANMRRRPMRTALTCITLILLTFTVLSFTSVTANITNFARPYGNDKNPPTYAGLMVRQPDWGAMQEAAVTSMSSEFRQRFGAVARRSWYLSRDQGELLQLRVASAADPSKFFHARALMGVTPEEATVGSPISKTLIAGKWFDDPTRRDVCLVPRWILLPKAQRQAESSAQNEGDKAADAPAAAGSTPELDAGPLLGMTPENAVGQKIQIAGQEMEIIGVFDNRKFSAARDLDGEEFTPVDYIDDQSKQSAQASSENSQKGEEVSVQSYQHTDANALLLIPYETVLMMGGNTRSLAAGFGPQSNPQVELNDLMNRAALGIFGSTPDKSGKLEAKLYSSVESSSYEGFAALVVPIMIAAMIIANTMLGSVFERTREIGIYSSVGLAPIHVAALFIAEAAVYAVLGSISGYLIAQVIAKIITANNVLQGITLNYSSGSAVVSTIIVMATVLLSTLYPAWAAGKMSSPDSDRRWKVSEALGDLWRFQFPFTVSGQQPLGVAQFLCEFFEAHTDTSVGKFYTDKVTMRSITLREAVTLLNTMPDGSSLIDLPSANGSAQRAHDAKIAMAAAQNSVQSTPAAVTSQLNTPDASTPGQEEEQIKVSKPIAEPVVGPQALFLENIAADPETTVCHIAMRTWLAPFDMGVSQDTDILLMPSPEPGLYELQIKQVRQSGEISAWKRTNRGFIADLRKQLLVWRMIKPHDQHEYILRGRAHVAGEVVPAAKPNAQVSAV